MNKPIKKKKEIVLENIPLVLLKSNQLEHFWQIFLNMGLFIKSESIDQTLWI